MYDSSMTILKMIAGSPPSFVYDKKKSKLAQYTAKGEIPYNRVKMVMMGGKKLRGNRVWSANKGGLVDREYKFSIKKLSFIQYISNNPCFVVLIL